MLVAPASSESPRIAAQAYPYCQTLNSTYGFSWTLPSNGNFRATFHNNKAKILGYMSPGAQKPGHYHVDVNYNNNCNSA